MKEFEDDNFKFDENGREISKQEENTIKKGEIALSPFPTVFSKHENKNLFWKGLKSLAENEILLSKWHHLQKINSL